MTSIFIDSLFYIDDLRDRWATPSVTLALTSSTRTIRNSLVPHIVMRTIPSIDDCIGKHIHNHHGTGGYRDIKSDPRHVPTFFSFWAMRDVLFATLKLFSPTIHFSNRIMIHLLERIDPRTCQPVKEMLPENLIGSDLMANRGYLSHLGLRNFYNESMSAACCQAMTHVEKSLASCNPLETLVLSSCFLGEYRYNFQGLLNGLKKSSNLSLRNLVVSNCEFDETVSFDEALNTTNNDNNSSNNKTFCRFFCDAPKQLFPNLRNLCIENQHGIEMVFRFEFLPQTLKGLRIHTNRDVRAPTEGLDWKNIPLNLETLVLVGNDSLLDNEAQNHPAPHYIWDLLPDYLRVLEIEVPAELSIVNFSLLPRNLESIYLLCRDSSVEETDVYTNELFPGHEGDKQLKEMLDFSHLPKTLKYFYFNLLLPLKRLLGNATAESTFDFGLSNMFSGKEEIEQYTSLRSFIITPWSINDTPVHFPSDFLSKLPSGLREFEFTDMKIRFTDADLTQFPPDLEIILFGRKHVTFEGETKWPESRKKNWWFGKNNQ